MPTSIETAALHSAHRNCLDCIAGRQLPRGHVLRRKLAQRIRFRRGCWAAWCRREIDNVQLLAWILDAEEIIPAL